MEEFRQVPGYVHIESSMQERIKDNIGIPVMNAATATALSSVGYAKRPWSRVPKAFVLLVDVAGRQIRLLFAMAIN